MNGLCRVSEDCGRPVAAWGMCKTHWARWRKWGDPYWAEPKSGVRPGNFKQAHCDVAGCEERHHAHGYCTKHAAAYKKYGRPDVKGNLGRKRKATITSAGAHKRVRYDRGPASNYTCVDCGGPAHEWSLRHDVSDDCRQEGWVSGKRGEQIWQAWSTNSQDYDARCRRCHRRYDVSGRSSERTDRGWVSA